MTYIYPPGSLPPSFLTLSQSAHMHTLMWSQQESQPPPPTLTPFLQITHSGPPFPPPPPLPLHSTPLAPLAVAVGRAGGRGGAASIRSPSLPRGPLSHTYLFTPPPPPPPPPPSQSCNMWAWCSLPSGCAGTDLSRWRQCWLKNGPSTPTPKLGDPAPTGWISGYRRAYL